MGTLRYRVRLRSLDDTEDLFVATSVRNGTHPYIKSAPRSDGQEVDPITGRVTQGATTIEIIDWWGTLCLFPPDSVLEDTTVASVTIASSLTLAAGGSGVLSAVARNAAGQVLPEKTVTWASDTPSVATAGPDSGTEAHQSTIAAVGDGTATVTATCDTVDSNACTVTVSSDAGVHEPAGMSVLVDHGCDTIADWFNIGGAETVQVVTDAGAPHSPSDVIEYAYVDASLGNFAGRKWSFAEQSELYISIWFKIQDPWDYHSSSVNKMFFIDTNASPSLDNEVVFSLIGSSEGNAQMRGIAQTPEGGSYRTCNIAPGLWTLGTYHRLEIHLVKNTAGGPNGTMRWWIDGTLRGEHTNVRYANAGDGKFDGFLLQPYYGGTPEDKTQVDKIFYDHLYISGKI